MNDRSDFDYVTTFPTLGHPEHHFNKYPDHPWLKTKDEIVKWLSESFEDNDNINWEECVNESDLTISLKGSIMVKFCKNKTHDGLVYIKAQFRECDNFMLMYSGLKSLIGSPYVCNYADFRNNELKSLEGFGLNYKSGVTLLQNSEIKNFNGMPKYLGENGTLMFALYKLESWEGFTSFPKVYLYTNEENVELVRNIPEGIDKLTIEIANKREEYSNYSDFKYIDGNVDLNWLRNKYRKGIDMENIQQFKFIKEEKVISKPGAKIVVKELALTEYGMKAITTGSQGINEGVTEKKSLFKRLFKR